MTFLDDNFKNLHAAEERFKILFSCLTGPGIFIVCLGLFALIALVTEQRTKEIGIRKVLGATIRSIVTLLTKDFLSLVALAFLLASPLAWYAMNRWLQDFAYRINMQWWMFALPGITALLIALLTISFQSIKTAVTNPVNSLRNE